MKLARKPTIYQILVDKFVIDGPKDKYFYSREIGTAKKLIKKYSQEFLEWVKPPFGYKVKSLIYFLSEDGKNYLGGQYFEFLKSQINLTRETQKPNDGPIVGDNVEIERKPKSLQEFLNI